MKAKTGSDFVFYASVSMLLLSLFMTLAANQAPAAPANQDRGYPQVAISGMLGQMARPATAPGPRRERSSSPR